MCPDRGRVTVFLELVTLVLPLRGGRNPGIPGPERTQPVCQMAERVEFSSGGKGYGSVGSCRARELLERQKRGLGRLRVPNRFRPGVPGLLRK